MHNLKLIAKLVKFEPSTFDKTKVKYDFLLPEPNLFNKLLSLLVELFQFKLLQYLYLNTVQKIVISQKCFNENRFSTKCLWL